MKCILNIGSTSIFLFRFKTIPLTKKNLIFEIEKTLKNL